MERNIHRGEAQTCFDLTVADEQSFVIVAADRLQQIAKSVLQLESVTTAQISIALVDDATIHEINRRFLDHDYPTDVISFTLSDAEEFSPASNGRPVAIEGEIVISAETAAHVAAELGHPAADELSLYLVHGLLHLCGYDDQAPADRQRMEQRQETHLKNLGIRPNYQGTSPPGRCSPPLSGIGQSSDFG